MNEFDGSNGYFWVLLILTVFYVIFSNFSKSLEVDKLIKRIQENEV